MRVIVIGAGPAGSLAAILLARHGASVRLIEQSRFPRDKVCGECLSALGRAVLRRHGLERPLLDAGAVELARAHLISPEAVSTLDLPEPMLGLSRSAMDTLLRDAAVEAGVELVQPARVEGVDSVPHSCARVRDLRSNAVHTFEADLVIVADGRGALLPEHPAASGDLGIKAHFEDVDADDRAITLFSMRGCYGGVAPIEDHRWNVALSVPAAQVKAHRGDVASLFEDLLSSNPAMARAFAHAKRGSDWLASPLPRHTPQDGWPARIIPVGNAAGAIEPIGGEGMGLALRSAELAASAIVAGSLEALPKQYQRLWRRRSAFCRIGGLMMSSRVTADAGVELSRIVPSRALLALVGK